MSKRLFGAVAVDLGATSGRFAAGYIEGGRLFSEVVEQIPHSPIDWNGRPRWDMRAILGLCQRAITFAQNNFTEAYLAIDSWGVDIGFVDGSNRLIEPPLCYRDPSHQVEMERLAIHRHRMYELTGIAHQPFNTIYQLAARRQDSPHLLGSRWFNMPDLIGLLLGGLPNHEYTMASTTQLMGLDGQWNPELFRLIGWTFPDVPPSLPGRTAHVIAPGVSLVSVGSHDTASAIFGLGVIPEDAMFLNTGTWSLAGVLLDDPIATYEAETAGFTNERTVDGRVRFLKNIPGFYVLNRLHAELAISKTIPEWLETAEDVKERIDLLSPDLYNPSSMLSAVTRLCGWEQATEEQWAGLALHSMTSTIAAQLPSMQRLTGRRIGTIRLSGGGSRSDTLCRSLARATGCTVVAGPTEATVLGNLAVALQARAAKLIATDLFTPDLERGIMLARRGAPPKRGAAHGPVRDRARLLDSARNIITASLDLKTYRPGEAP
jgi:rhamnulokinase